MVMHTCHEVVIAHYWDPEQDRGMRPITSGTLAVVVMLLAVASALVVAGARQDKPAPGSGRPVPAAAPLPIVELRQYTLLPGKRDVLIELFDREFIEGQEA